VYIRTVLSGGCCLALFAAAASAATLSKADKQFMVMAAKTNMIEAHEGQLGENQASQEGVKNLAKELVQDHTASYEELSALAAKTGVSIPRGIDAARNRTIAQLVHEKGAGFDRQFARDEIAAHRNAIAVFKREAEHGHDAAVKAYAAKTIPVLEKHLHLAESLAKPAARG